MYDGIPHLIRPVITDPKSAARGLDVGLCKKWSVDTGILAEHGVRSIDAYNRKSCRRTAAIPFLQTFKEESESLLLLSDDLDVNALDESSDTPLTRILPYIVVVIDEFADLMMVAPKEVEDRIARSSSDGTSFRDSFDFSHTTTFGRCRDRSHKG